MWPGACAFGWVLCYSATWLVSSASRRFGYRNSPVPDLTANCWWVALVAYGEVLRRGMRFWEIGPAHTFICLVQAVGLAWNRQVPPAHNLQFRRIELT